MRRSVSHGRWPTGNTPGLRVLDSMPVWPSRARRGSPTRHTERPMRKSIFFRLLGFGGIPRRLRPVLDSEGIVVADEGIPGRFITRDVRAPGKRYRQRSEGFSGFLAVTGKRIVCFSYAKRQINIAVDDPQLGELFICRPQEETLSISFESSLFRDGWSGMIELQFETGKAKQFHEVLLVLGARQGTAS